MVIMTRSDIENKVEAIDYKVSKAIDLNNETYSSYEFRQWLNKWGPLLRKLTAVQKDNDNKIDGNIWNHDSSVFYRLPQLNAYLITFTLINMKLKEFVRPVLTVVIQH